MKVYLIYPLSQMPEMTLQEIKAARDKFELWRKMYSGKQKAIRY